MKKKKKNQSRACFIPDFACSTLCQTFGVNFPAIVMENQQMGLQLAGREGVRKNNIKENQFGKNIISHRVSCGVKEMVLK